MKVKSVGYYKEMPCGRNSSYSLFDYLNKEDMDCIENICHYLESGIEFIVSPGITQDVINPENGDAGTSSTYTDGEWIWPGDLAYYVKQYKLKLPSEFVKTMENNGWIVKKTLDELDLDVIEVDGIRVAPPMD